MPKKKERRNQGLPFHDIFDEPTSAACDVSTEKGCCRLWDSNPQRSGRHVLHNDGAQERLGRGRQIAGQARLSLAIEDHQEHVPGVQIDAGVKLRRGGWREGTHGKTSLSYLRRGDMPPLMMAKESLHEYPAAAPDRRPRAAAGR